ncbi:MAG: penicillin-binding protein 1A [Pseudohongiellaceae bacterium]
MHPKLNTIAKTARLIFFATSAGVIMILSAAYLYLAPLLPAADTYRNVQLETPLRIYTSDGRLIDEIGNRRNPVIYEEIPRVLLNAVIATEDSRFYSHPGVDLQSLLRVFYGAIRGQRTGGGSTITMQLAKNLSFDSDSIYLRKLKEIPFALQIQRELSKEEVLTLYLNTIYFGAGADGIGAAAYVYYGKEASELTLAESAMMASLLPCPSTCNPLNSGPRSITRREVRLRNMFRQGMISQQEYEIANAAPITAMRRNRNIEVPAPYVTEMVRQQLYDEFGERTYSGGFEVITSIDGDKQLAANQAVAEGLEQYYDRRHGYRGAEANYPPDILEPIKIWQEKLESIPSYGDQPPAIVTKVDELSFDALLKSGEMVTIPWEGMSWAYAFRSRNEAWPPPSVAADVAKIGDLIRLKAGDSSWTLGQVPDIQGALVSMSTDNGRVLALVGGYDFNRSQVNRVLTPRPPGSNFKPFVYGAALEAGYTAASTINDAPITRGNYRPNNFENNFLGPVTLRFALKESRNVPAVRLFDQLGSDTVLKFANKFGFQTDTFPANDLTVALGSHDVQPIEVVSAYSALANGGFKVDPWFIAQVSNLGDGIIYRASPATVCENCPQLNQENGTNIQAAPRIVDAEVAYILNTMLRSVIEEGSGNRVQRELNRSDLMGKTGTTNGPRELWFSGFNRDIATTVFVGFDQPEPLGEREQGATVAVPIWIDYMQQALKGMPERVMNRPDGLVDQLINIETGEPATPGDLNAVFEVFRLENAPNTGAPNLPGADAEDDAEEVSTETIF